MEINSLFDLNSLRSAPQLNRIQIKKLREELEVNSVRYLDLKDMIAAFPENVKDDFCTGCIDGNYKDRDIEECF